nr:MAG: hypothetical protein A3K41_04205 [Chloroflexi bacterium RIFOXYD12_FULL_57_15]
MYAELGIQMYAELGIQPSALAVANHYRGVLTGFVLDSVDAQLAGQIPVQALVTDTLMKSIADRARVARDVLNFIGNLS